MGPNFAEQSTKLCNEPDGTTTRYFNLNTGTRQGDPLSVYLFALVIEVLFIMVRENVDIKGPNLFGTEVKLTACADETTLFFEKSQFPESIVTSICEI